MLHITPIFSYLKQWAFIISSIYKSGILVWLNDSVIRSVMRWQSVCQLGLQSCLQSNSGGSASKLTYMVVGRIQLFIGCWNKGLGISLVRHSSHPCHGCLAQEYLTPWNQLPSELESKIARNGPRWKPHFLCNLILRQHPITFAVLFTLDMSF